MRTIPLLALLAALLAPSCETTWDAPNRDLHGPSDIDEYIQRLEDERRVKLLQVDVVIDRLGIESDDWIGDLGCGPGMFSLPLAQAAPDGLVFATDIEPAQLDRLRERMAQAEIDNVLPILASYHDPHFPPASLDLVLIVDTYHHLEDRVAYLRRLARSMKPNGRLAVLEFKPGDLPVGPPADKKPGPGVMDAELTEAGWVSVQRFDTHPYHDFVVYRRARE